MEQILLTVQNFGHKARRLYSLNYSFSCVNVDELKSRWSYLVPIIEQATDGNGQQVFETLVEYLFKINVSYFD